MTLEVKLFVQTHLSFGGYDVWMNMYGLVWTWWMPTLECEPSENETLEIYGRASNL